MLRFQMILNFYFIRYLVTHEYMKVMREPWLSDNKILDSLKEENIRKFIIEKQWI